MHYDWVPVVKRKPLVWPNGKRPGAIVTVNCEFWDLVKGSTEPCYAGGPPMLPDPLPGNVADFPNFTRREYGLRVGAWCMFRVFEDAGVRISCTLKARTALDRPEIVAHANARGWELVAHNYEQGELPTRLTFDEAREREVIAATPGVYERVVGRKAHDGAWFATRDAVATWHLANHATHIG